MAAGFIRLACGDNTIVAAFTYTLRFIVIDRDYWRPSCVVVAGFTKIACQDMCGAFTTCERGVMTGNTGFRCRGVIKHRYCPAIRSMATVTFQSRRNMYDAYANCNRAIMATRASTCHSRMIH